MKAYIFDLDGTLLDSMGMWGKIAVDYLAVRGIAVASDYVRAVNALSFEEAAEYTAGRFALAASPHEIVDEWNRMAERAYGSEVALKPGAEQYLRELRARGAALAVATSLPRVLCAAALRGCGIEDLFGTVCLVEQVGRGKEHPDVFLLAAHKLGAVPGECTVFEDILPAILSAKRAGMTVYGVYDASWEADIAEIKRQADGVIYDFKDAPLPE